MQVDFHETQQWSATASATALATACSKGDALQVHPTGTAMSAYV